MPTITVEQALQTAAAFQRAGQAAAAERIYRMILSADSRRAEAWHALGTLALVAGQPARAIPDLTQAVAQAPENGTYRSDLGVALRQAGRTEEAVVSFRRGAELLPQAAGIHVNLGEALAALGRFEEATRSYEQAVSVRPDFPEAHSNLGRALLQMGRLEEAVAACERAIAARPDLPEAHLNLGAALLRQQRFVPAIAAFRRAVVLRPDYLEAHQTLAFLLLLLGHYEEGWKEHEWRWQSPAWAQRWRPFVAPRWDGRPAPGATLRLHVEQGFGDALQFLRYLPIVRERFGGEVVLYCMPQLGRLLAAPDNCPATVIAVESLDGATLPATDRHLPLLSLPATLGLYEPQPMAGPYLRSDPEVRSVWRERLQGATGLRVGLEWAGNPAHRDDRARSIAAEQIAALFKVPGVTFVNLQVDGRNPVTTVSKTAGQWLDLTGQITDFADTAALMDELDLIISVDTAAAHLAGALGRLVWTLLPFVPDWRWGLEREDTPWYPTMRLFRQKSAGDWEEVIARVAKELRALVAPPPRKPRKASKAG